MNFLETITLEKLLPPLLLLLFVSKTYWLPLVFKFKNMSDREFDDLYSQTPLPRIIDVRTEGEYASRALRGVENIPLGRVKETLFEHKVSLETPLYLLCASGNRSLYAACSLKMAGFQNVTNIRGGMMKVGKLAQS